ncbi:hypothetical protein D3OALGA1CA_1384 [Olavius algarvensis associated proteobacterium Delta 3]|nr:hypothetical protein D3OALGA1CA_1384 [Olavius algarvensis associated proteobacterium Delta 3]CAB5108336.1 hypothetical protein D3OALGB2SA_2263 [Olavius algarvensis associated proteobacterium Delta 3]
MCLNGVTGLPRQCEKFVTSLLEKEPDPLSVQNGFPEN